MLRKAVLKAEPEYMPECGKMGLTPPAAIRPGYAVSKPSRGWMSIDLRLYRSGLRFHYGTDFPAIFCSQPKISKTTPCKVARCSLAGRLYSANILTRRANHRHYSNIAQQLTP